MYQNKLISMTKNHLPELFEDPIDNVEHNFDELIINDNVTDDSIEPNKPSSSIKTFQTSGISNTKDLPKTNNRVKYRKKQ